MAGMITKTLKAEFKPQEKPRKRDFRRQLKGDHAELMNSFCVEISAKWGVSGPDAFQILTDALWRAAMEHGTLNFFVNGAYESFDISERKYGDHLGLLKETRTWDSTGADSDDGEAGDSGEQKALDTPAPEARITPAAASLSAEQLALLDSVREGKDIPLETPEAPVEPLAEAPTSEPVLETGVEPAAALTVDSERDEGDARNQLPMSLGDEDHQEQPQVEQPEVETPVGNGEDDKITTQPVRVKPDFKALMSRNKKSD